MAKPVFFPKPVANTVSCCRPQSVGTEANTDLWPASVLHFENEMHSRKTGCGEFFGNGYLWLVGNFVNNSVIMFISFGIAWKFIKDIKLNCYFVLAVLQLVYT